MAVASNSSCIYCPIPLLRCLLLAAASPPPDPIPHIRPIVLPVSRHPCTVSHHQPVTLPTLLHLKPIIHYSRNSCRIFILTIQYRTVHLRLDGFEGKDEGVKLDGVNTGCVGVGEEVGEVVGVYVEGGGGTVGGGL